MKCPSCGHVNEAGVHECADCGETLDPELLEGIDRLEFLIAWLDDQAEISGADAHERLRDVAGDQLEALREQAGLSPVGIRKADLPAEISGVELAPEILRPVQEISKELGPVEAVLERLPDWVDEDALSLAAAIDLHEDLALQASNLNTELSGRPGEIEPRSELQTIEYSLEKLGAWGKDLGFHKTDSTALGDYLQRKRRELLEPEIEPPIVAIERPIDEVGRELALVGAVQELIQDWVEDSLVTQSSALEIHDHLAVRIHDLKSELAGRSAPVAPPANLEVLDFVLESLPHFIELQLVYEDEAIALRRHLSRQRKELLEPLPAPVPPESVDEVIEIEPVLEEPPAKPTIASSTPAIKRAAPAFNWANLWERSWKLVVSGALLRGLLYLGAFMIVVSAYVLVIRFWDVIPRVLQLVSIASVPTVFYLTGWEVRARWKLPQVGGALTGIGSLLVGADLGAIYQLGGLAGQVNGNVYWFAASLLCTGIYAATAWRLPTEFFGYITFIGVSSTVLALTRMLQIPLDWVFGSLTAASVVMIEVSARLARRPKRWSELGQAARRLPQILIPVSMALALAIPGKVLPGGLGAFLFAAIGFGLLAWHFQMAVYAHASVWSFTVMAALTILVIGIPLEWYASVMVAIASLYVLAGRWLDRRLPEDFHQRRSYLRAPDLAGWALLVLGSLTGVATLFFHSWAGIFALTLAAISLGWRAYLERRPSLGFFASGLFILPFSLAIRQWYVAANVQQLGAWMMAAWVALGLIYLAIAVILHAADQYVRWLNLWAHILAPAASAGLVFSLTADVDARSSGPTLVALGGVILIYLSSAWIHDSGRHPALSKLVSWLPTRIRHSVFLWPVGGLVPVWIAVSWLTSTLESTWLGVMFAGMALGYVGLGQLLARRSTDYRLPFHACAYALSLVGIPLALDGQWPLLTALSLVVGVLGWLAFVYRRVFEIALASILFLWPFQLSLMLSPLGPSAYSLAYALLAALGYIPVGILLERAKRAYAMPGYLIGYALSTLAVVSTLLSRFGLLADYVPWLGTATLLVVTGLLVFSNYWFRQRPFAWAAAAVLPLSFSQSLTVFGLESVYFAEAWLGLGLAYMLTERRLAASLAERSQGKPHQARWSWLQDFRWPLGTGALAFVAIGLSLTAAPTLAAFTGEHVENHFPAILAQATAVGIIVLAARLYRSRWPLVVEPWLAFFPTTLFFIGYGPLLFEQTLAPFRLGIIWSVLGLIHLLAASVLDRAKVRYAHGLYLGGYALTGFSVIWALGDRSVLLWTLGLGIVAASGSAILVHFNLHRSWDELISSLLKKSAKATRTMVRDAFLWLASWSFPVWCVLLLKQLGVAEGWHWLGFTVPALGLLGLAVWSRRFARSYAWPFQSAAQFYTAAGLILSAPFTTQALTGNLDLSADRLTATGFILLQALATVFYGASARTERKRVFTYITSFVAFFPVTLFFIGYGPSLIGQVIAPSRFAILWAALALSYLLIGALLDPAKVRYAHGPYLAGYTLIAFSIGWSLGDRLALLWALGLGILATCGSAVLVHANRHQTWDELVNTLFRRTTSVLRSTTRGAFLWLTAWGFPVWCALLLHQLEVADGWRWLGFGFPALLLLGLGWWSRRFERTYAWPFHSAGQFYMGASLILSAPVTARLLAGYSGPPSDELVATGFIVLQTLAVIFYAASAWVFRRGLFTYIAAPVSFFPYTLAWILFRPSLLPTQVALTWAGLSAVLLAVGFTLDRSKTRLSHGPYLTGYLLACLALAWSMPDRLVNVMTLAGVVGLAIASQVIVHRGRHRSYDDFVGFIWRKPGTIAHRTALTAFLFFAAYASAALLAQLLAYFGAPTAWRGLGFALAAPLYIAAGVAARRAKGEYTWPLYSVGYALTAIGAMVAFDDLRIAIYVMAINTAVYAASAAIFRQAFWLYISNSTIPIIALLALSYGNALSASWVARIFIGLAFLYFVVGQWFERKEEFTDSSVTVYARPFYALSFLLSAISLAAASGDRSLALQIYPLGAALYAVAAWRMRETLLIYPAAWLVAVPYYLAVTLTPVPREWYGLSWFPLVLGYILLARFLFQKAPPSGANLRNLNYWITEASAPFYLMAYALSVSMIALSLSHPPALTLALAAAAATYFGTARLFRSRAWLYPGLIALHFSLLASLSIRVWEIPGHYAAVPFLGLSLIVAACGYWLTRHTALAQDTGTPVRMLRIRRWELNFNDIPFIRHLIQPTAAQPFFHFLTLDIFLWQILALSGFDTAIVLATGHAILIGLLAMLWRDRILPYGALFFSLLAFGYRLGWESLSLAEGLAWMGGIGFGYYWLARIAERVASSLDDRARSLGVWIKPLRNSAIFLATLGVVGASPAILEQTSASAAALAFAGALYLVIAYRRRRHILGYISVAMLEAAWVSVLLAGEISQPQFYAIPAGLYFIGVGHLEHQQKRATLGMLVESLGLAVLLIASFMQSLDESRGFLYFLLLLLEGLVVIGWGAINRRKIPFFAGLSASVLNVIAQIVLLINVYDINRFVVLLAVGLLLVASVVFLERQRENILARAQLWRETLETWN